MWCILDLTKRDAAGKYVPLSEERFATADECQKRIHELMVAGGAGLMQRSIMPPWDLGIGYRTDQ